jgi:hypothetical protein
MDQSRCEYTASFRSQSIALRNNSQPISGANNSLAFLLGSGAFIARLTFHHLNFSLGTERFPAMCAASSVAVIGGVATSLCLRGMGLLVTLGEQRADVLLDSSLIPGRLHYGGMYFQEYIRKNYINSAAGCVSAAIAFHQTFRGDIWSEDLGTVFLLADSATTLRHKGPWRVFTKGSRTNIND